jgi:hypothetical protein
LSICQPTCLHAESRLLNVVIVGEVEVLIEEHNKFIRRRANACRVRTAVLLLTTAEAAAALWMPPDDLASGPTAALARQLFGGAKADDKADAEIGVVRLLAKAQRFGHRS